MTYIQVENNIIKGFFCGGELPEGAVEVPESFTGHDGDDIRSFDKDTFELRPISELIADGLYMVKADELFEAGSLRKKTQIEKYIDGTDKIPDGMKLSGDKKELITMTLEELLAGNFITSQEYNARFNQNVNVQIVDIDAQLNALDLKSIRSRGEIQDGEDTDGKAAAQLAKYKAEITALRTQRATLAASLKSA